VRYPIMMYHKRTNTLMNYTLVLCIGTIKKKCGVTFSEQSGKLWHKGRGIQNTSTHPLLMQSRCRVKLSLMHMFVLLTSPISLLHSKNLDHTDKNVDKVKLERDALIDRIRLHEAALAHPCVMQHLLHIVKSEATKDDKTSVEPDVLTPHQSSCRSSWDNERRESGKSDDCDTSEQRSTNVKVLLLLGSSSNKGKRAHHTDGVETGASKNARCEEHHWREESGLGKVEGSPGGILGNVTVRR